MAALWRAMDQALLESNGTIEVDCGSLAASMTLPDGGDWAAVIRVVAEQIPEEFYGANGVRAWLLEEAVKAEARE